MYLKKLELRNFRCFENLEISFHDRMTVLVGGNGSGKTSVMEGAAVAMGTLLVNINGLYSRAIIKSDAHLKVFSFGGIDDVQPQYPVEVITTGRIEGAEGQWKRSLNGEGERTMSKDARFLTDISAEYQKRLREGDSSLVLPVLAYYGTGRLWDYHREKKTDTFKTSTRTNGYIDCLDGMANIKLMMNWLKKMTIQKYQQQEEGGGPIPGLEAVYRAMEACLASVTDYRDIKMRYNLSMMELDVCYTDENKARMRIPLSQLSDGYKGTVSLVADIAYRMANLNPQLSERILTDTDGIVLIDEIDLHLHPEWQQKILSDLEKIFPKVQFIVSTHAPAIINSVRSENLLILKESQIFQAASQVYGKDVKSVLNEIMEVAERPPEVAGLFEEFYEQLAGKEFDQAERTLDEIDELRGYHDQEVAGCRVKLKLERVRGGRI